MSASGCRSRLSLLTMLVSMAVSGSAHAEVEEPFSVDESPSAPAPAATKPALPAVPTERYWYGYQTLAVDGAALALTLVGSTADVSALTVPGVVGLFVGAPIVHAAHNRVPMAFGSFGVRLGLPALGMVIGQSAAGPCHDDEKPQGFSFLGNCFLHGWREMAYGALIGFGAAVALDSTVFARGTRPLVREQQGIVPRIASIAPTVDPRSRAAGLNVGGTF